MITCRYVYRYICIYVDIRVSINEKYLYLYMQICICVSIYPFRTPPHDQYQQLKHTVQLDLKMLRGRCASKRLGFLRPQKHQASVFHNSKTEPQPRLKQIFEKHSLGSFCGDLGPRLFSLPTLHPSPRNLPGPLDRFKRRSFLLLGHCFPSAGSLSLSPCLIV